MTIIFEKKVTSSEKKWKFITVPAKVMKSLPKTFEIIIQNQKFTVNINAANRISAKSIFEVINPNIGDQIIFEKLDSNYNVYVKNS